MAKAVFIASSHSAYDDSHGEKYHFPNQYLSRVEQAIGDWVIFYQGRRGGRAGYYAVQRVARVVPDPADSSHSYALLDQASLLDFVQIVPRLNDDHVPYETGLPLSRGSNTSAVRLINDIDFAAIITQGLREDASPEGLARIGTGNQSYEFAEDQAGFEVKSPVLRPQVLSQRAFRERAFARHVKSAYGGTCAMSGLSLRNGGGRMEVEAAHIVPVEAQGPDTIRNGLALSGTVHWMFDRGLVSVDADYRILVARETVATGIAERLFLPDLRLLLPSEPEKRPHQTYFDWHRRHRFKG